MEVNESAEVRSTGTPPTNGGNGGGNCCGSSPAIGAPVEHSSGTKILSKNSNGTSERTFDQYYFFYSGSFYVFLTLIHARVYKHTRSPLIVVWMVVNMYFTYNFEHSHETDYNIINMWCTGTCMCSNISQNIWFLCGYLLLLF